MLQSNSRMYNKLTRALILSAFIVCLVSCNDEPEAEQKNAEQAPATPSKPDKEVIQPVLVNQFPHETSAYTEGLQFVDGVMYESTGQYGRSYVYKYELGADKMMATYRLGNEYFGEGLTVMGDTVYVLTYKEHTGFMFDKNTFRLLGKFKISAREGWGLTNDSTHLIYSDGTSALHFVDPKTKADIKTLQVSDQYGPVININELEYINGYIYANQYETEYILKIDPANGKVVGLADLSRIRRQAGIADNRHIDGQPEVMNGIAYDRETNKIYITGKNWPKILEVKLDN